jgi:uncharacterized protein YecE (DUF72 family)
MPYWVGTSGYSYPDWVGSFYPSHTRPTEMLPYYSRHFPLVEINYTFYRPPTPTQLTRLAARVPSGFQFLIKLPKALSHDRQRAEIVGFRKAVEALQERGQLLGLLCQLPQSAHCNGAARSWLEELNHQLPGLGLAVEFRHRSWARPEVPRWLADHAIDLVAVDVPGLPALYPRGLVASGPNVYVRFHSRNAELWYASDGARYDYDYTDAELTEWVDATVSGAPGAETPGPGRTLFLFNNCQGSQAARNAQRMMALLRARGADLVAPPPGQRGLFD